MRVLITGAGGQLGEELAGLLADKHEVVACDHSRLDITDKDQVEEIIEETGPEAVVNCAAYTDVDGSEDNSEIAFAVNAVGVKNLVEKARDRKIHLIHISTDYVFSGRSDRPYRIDDCPEPINTYGISKLAGEYFVRNYEFGAVIRTAGVYGGEAGKHNNFLNTILKLTEEKDELQVVDDQVTSPTWTKYIAEFIESVLEEKMTGLIHYSARGECSWYEFARSIIKLKNKQITVKPISSKNLNQEARRPFYSVLENNVKINEQIPVNWNTMLEEYLPAGSK